MNIADVIFDPLLPWRVIYIAAAVAAVMTIYVQWRGLSGWLWRGLAAAFALLAIANPSLQWRESDPLSDIVLLVTDESASQHISDRAGQTRRAIDDLRARLAGQEGVTIQEVSVGDGDDNQGSLLGKTVGAALADIPSDRLAGIVVVTDGQVHDAPMLPALPAPAHVLLTGEEGDWDRRLIVTNAPAFAILGEPVTLRVRVEDQGAVPANVPLSDLQVSIDGNTPITIPALPGDELEFDLTLSHGGINVIQLSLGALPGELTDRNNAAIVQINGVRDRLSVLLVSGEPHPGGRTWRNLLKSDSAVDLVHFTILRPPEKQDRVPVSELSLIAFPTRELFLEKIDEFDLIIFDRYRRRGILPAQYLDNIRQYVEGGGAVLMAAGPEFASANSLFYSSIGDMLPVIPTSRVIEAPFKPEISDLGRRHPVTKGLDEEWGDWLRLVEVEPLGGQTVMVDNANRPLLVLDRIGSGRVAMLASDQAWLWTRGYKGGGPQLELLRRLSHWMMKEPELEEEALEINVQGQTMRVTRRSLSDAPRELKVTHPDGSTHIVQMQAQEDGDHFVDYEGPELGLYRLEQDGLSVVAALGPSAPKEFEDTIATGAVLDHWADSSGGSLRRISDGLPAIRWVPEGRNAAGQRWIGLTRRDASITTSVSLRELLPAWAGLILAASLILFGWLREGRR